MSSNITPITSLQNGRPICWNWSLQDIIHYVNNYKALAFQNYIAEDPSDTDRHQSFGNLVNCVLLKCLELRRVYAPESPDSPQFYTCNLSFHYRKGREVPIADVYSALGWFMSYAGDSNGNLEQDYHLFVCYTRLCHIIGLQMVRERDVVRRGEFFHPAKTHLLWMESCILLTVDPPDEPAVIDRRFHMSFSASLPRDPAMARAKKIFKNIRTEMINRLVGSTILGWMNSIKADHVGVCAETLTYASFFSDDPKTVVVTYGEALTVDKVGPEFTGYQNVVNNAHCHPCETCRALFSYGRVTQQDIGSGRILGPLPPHTRITADWSERNNVPLCISCRHAYNPNASYKNLFCKKKCFDRYVEYCERNRNNFPPRLDITRYAPPPLPPSTSGQNVIPATVGEPDPRPLKYRSPVENWVFYGPPGVSNAPNNPPRSGGPSAGPSTGFTHYDRPHNYPSSSPSGTYYR